MTMRLESLYFTEFPGQPGEWGIEKFILGKVNLVVGRNAVGKTRLLNAINFLGTAICGTISEISASCRYQVCFKDEDKSWDYELDADIAEISKESLLYNNKDVMQRGKDCSGQIENEEVQKRIRFKTGVK